MGCHGPAHGPSISAVASDDGWQGAQENGEVEGEGPGVDVAQVVGDPAVEVGLGGPRFDLPEAGEAGGDVEAAPVPGPVLGGFFWQGRPGTHEAHLAPEH